MRISVSQNIIRPIFKVIYYKIYAYIGENLPHFGEIFVFWGNFRGFSDRNVLGIFVTKVWGVFRGFFQFELATVSAKRSNFFLVFSRQQSYFCQKIITSH
jgi:hypothetical protein